MQLDSSGLIGTYDFVYVPLDVQNQANAGCAFVNFIDSCFVVLFCWIYQECQLQGSISMAEVQGVEANYIHWSQDEASAGNMPTMMTNAMPSQWAVNAANTMLSPQVKGQFRKTKMCAFNRKNRCELGASCPFAHTLEELQPMPDLAKTKLCYNFFRRRCSDSKCKFAHGSAELRSVWMPYSPGVWLPPMEEAELEWDPLQEAMPMPPFQSPEDAETQMALLGDAQLIMQEAASSESSIGTEQLRAGTGTSCGTARASARELFEALPSPACPRGGRDRADSLQSSVGSVALRVRGTFMEAMKAPEESDDLGLGPTLRTSWSESNLAALREAMEEASDL